jgi:membrane protein implicated in regulation of membrane protease activity
LLNLKVILKYTLLNLAELGLIVVALILVEQVIDIPTWLTITILALWILKDIAIFPKVWRAYIFDDNRPLSQLIGLEATVMDSLNPVGYVRVNGELWRAEIRNPRYPAKTGDRTKVVDVKGMTLVVERSTDRTEGWSVDDVPR